VLDDAEPLARAQIGANLNKFGELLEGFADWSNDRSLALALRYLEILRSSHAADEVAAVETTRVGISLLTAHAARDWSGPSSFSDAAPRSAGRGWGGSPLA